MPDDIEDIIAEQAAEPASMTTDAGTTTNRSMDDLIKADKHLANKRAAASGSLGIRLTKVVGPDGVW